MRITGWISRIDENRISGWVHSFDYPSRSERVGIVIDGVTVLQLLAHKERPDLRGRDFPFVRKGFEFTLSDFTEKAANLVEIIHVETGIKLGAERYTVFSVQHDRWLHASDAELKIGWQILRDRPHLLCDASRRGMEQ